MYKLYKDTYYEYKYLDKIYKIDDINPLLEKRREEILNNIQNKFKNTIRKHISDDLIKGKHSVERILETMLARFVMGLLSDENNVDPVIPNIIKNYASLEEDLRVKLRKDKSISKKEQDNIIKKILTELNLQKQLDDGVSNLIEYYNSEGYRNNKDNVNIIKSSNKKYISLTFNDDTIDIYQHLYNKLLKRYNSLCIFTSERSEFAKGKAVNGVSGANVSEPSETKINSLLSERSERSECNEPSEARSSKTMQGSSPKARQLKYNVNILIWCIIKRYMMLKSYNQQLAVHPATYRKIGKCYNTYFELFGSVLNTHNKSYCSIFYDIEKYFGSRGSFFSFIPIRGSYYMNPPFDNILMKNAADHIVEAMKKSDKKITIFVYIPVWDNKGKQYIEKTCKYVGKISYDIYGGYPVLEILESSEMIQYKKIVCLKDFTYFDYMWFKKTTAAHSYVIVIQNEGTFDSKCLDEINFMV